MQKMWIREIKMIIVMRELIIITGLLVLLLVPVYSLARVEGSEECKEIGDNHGDTSESESKLYKQLETQNFCEFVQDHDREEIKGEIREDTKHDWEWFVQTKVFQTAFEDAIFCMLDRYDLPDDGDKRLAGYEIQDCGQGNY